MLYQMKVSQNSITFTWSASKGHPRLTAKVPVEGIMTWSFWWLAIIRIPPNQHNQSSTIIKIQQNSFCCFQGFQRIDFRRYWSGGRMIPNRVGGTRGLLVFFLYLGWLGRVKVVLESIVTLCGQKSFSTLETVRLVCIQFSCFDPMNYGRYCFCQSLFHWVHKISQIFLSFWDRAQNNADFSLTRKKNRVLLLVDTH